MRTVFYSWQSDLPNATNRGFIEDCLEQAIDDLHAQEKIRVFEPDRDVQGESGSPDIAETIFEKIDRCSAFVADVSYINGANLPTSEDQPTPCKSTRLSPNPNVMGEWGRATKSVGFPRIIAVLNTATGRVEDLPFDMRKRSVVTYCLVKGEEKKEAKKMLVGKFKAALKEILALPSALLDLQFAALETQEPIGCRFAASNTFFEIDQKTIPDFGYRSRAQGTFAGLDDDFANAMANRHFWRQKAKYVFYSQLMKPVRLILTNAGGKLLSNVRLEVAVGSAGVGVMDESDMPDMPERDQTLGMSSAAIRGIRPVRFRPGELTVSKVGEAHRIDVKFGNVQAKAKVVSEAVYLAGVNRETTLTCLLFADELSEPIPVPLTIQFTSEIRKMSFDELKNFSEKADMDEVEQDED